MDNEIVVYSINRMQNIDENERNASTYNNSDKSCKCNDEWIKCT